MIRDEEQRAQELEQEIALMQCEGHHDLQHGPPLQQHASVGDLFIPQRGPFIPHAAAFQGINYLDERSPLAPQLQVSPWPANFRAGTYPKYNGSTDLAQYIMSYQVAVASSGGDDATMAKSFIIALEGPALTWYTRLPPLSIDSWRSLRDKFLLGHNPPTTQELSRTHINTTTHNHTTTALPSIYPTTHINTTRRYKSYHPHSRLRINQTSTTKITPKHQNRKASLISRIAESFT
jgi:hypothetical protein